MGVDECKIGVLPNVAINPETGCHAVTGEPVEYPSDQGDGLRTACYDYERRIKALTRERDNAQILAAEVKTHLKAIEAECNRLSDKNLHLQDALRHKQKVCDIQRESFRKMEVEVAALRHLALGMWRCLDTLLLAHRAPTKAQVDGWAQSLAARGIEAE